MVTTQASALCKFKGEMMMWFIVQGSMDIGFKVVHVVGKFRARDEVRNKGKGHWVLLASLLFHESLLGTRQYIIIRSNKMASEERRWQNSLEKSSRCDIELWLSLLQAFPYRQHVCFVAFVPGHSLKRRKTTQWDFLSVGM